MTAARDIALRRQNNVTLSSSYEFFTLRAGIFKPRGYFGSATCGGSIL